MNTIKLIDKFLNENGVQLSTTDFIEITSNIYHKFESAKYDNSHFSIELSKPYWEKAIFELDWLFRDRDKLRLLDFGCGTGFATEQILVSNFKHKCNQIVCYDLSPDMIQICKKKFQNIENVSYLSDRDGFEELKSKNGKFDVIVCNAIIHHVLDHKGLFKVLEESLSENGIIIIGHEPNKSFYQNETLQKVSNIYRIYKKMSNKITSLFSRKLKNGYEGNANISELTYNELLEKKYITETFPKNIIQKLVDIHVPMSTLDEQPWGELGFDQCFFYIFSENKLKVIKQTSYNHIKDQQAYKNVIWKFISKILERQFPNDGADTIFILNRN